MNTTLHAPVEALLKIMSEHGLRYTDIDEIDAAWQRVEPFLAKREVKTVVSAQASLPFALAVAAVRGRVGVDEFTDETVGRSGHPVDDPTHRRPPGQRAVREGEEQHAGTRHGAHEPTGANSPTKFSIRRATLRTRSPKTSSKPSSWTWPNGCSVTSKPNELYERARNLTDAGDVADLAPLFSPK